MIFYFDENLSFHFANSLNELEKAAKEHKVISTTSVLNEGAQDEEIIEYIGKHKGVLITQDMKIRNTGQYQLIQKHKIGAVFIRPRKGASYYELFGLIAKAWPKIRTKFSVEFFPECYLLTAQGKLNKHN